MSRRLDRPSILYRVEPQKLVPASAWAQEQHDEFRIGTEVDMTPRARRSTKKNAKYWWILGKIVGNTEWPSARALHRALMVETRNVEATHLIGGGLHIEPISITEMNDREFEDYYEHAMLILCTEVIPGLDIEALKDEGEVRLRGFR